MPNARDPFELEDGFENVPVTSAAGNAVKAAVSTVSKATASQLKKAADDATQQILGALYGTSTPSVPDTDQGQPVADTTVDPLNPTQQTTTSLAQPAPQQQAQPAQQQQQQNPQADQAQRELQQKHRSDYYIPTFGDISNLEADVRKREEERKQAAQQEEQQEEQEKEQMEDLEEKKKKEEVPLAVQQARNKAENRPGAG